MHQESAAPAPKASLARRLARFTRKAVEWAVGIFITIYMVRAFDSLRMPDLELWHSVSLDDFRAGEVVAGTTFDDYLAREAGVFDQMDREVYSAVEPSEELSYSRYNPGGVSDPRGFERNWNRTFELEPAETPRGAALLVHGLTDSPYSLRRVGEILHERGFYVLGLRLPGHGTTPGSLAEVSWRDWRAAVRLAAKHVSERKGGGEFVIVGYSCGGALVIDYAVDAIEDGLPRADRLILFSPAIGITALARMASMHRFVSWIPLFEKFRWSGIEPEYDPFKYNSFPKNGGEQMRDLSLTVQDHLRSFEAGGRRSELPPMLAFQSLIDATVLTSAVVDELCSRLTPGSELVLFDTNRKAKLRQYVRDEGRDVLERLERDEDRVYQLTLVANVDETPTVELVTYEPGSSEPILNNTAMSWPPGVYSLSHVAIPIPPNDPIYGAGDGKNMGMGPLSIGSMQPRGERGLLRVSVAQLMRLRYNPFFDVIEDRLRGL